jgi:TonB-dependent starch-binding outer membrane protein SusC
MSYMGRLNYSLMDKYLITASARWDGASMLAEGHKWDVFSSFALAWKLDKEAFMKDINFISELKPRIGYGSTGNSAISAYGTLGGLMTTYYRWGATDVAGFLPTRPAESDPAKMPNKDLGWEKTAQLNFGADFGLFSNRISGSIDYYVANTSNVLMVRSIPSVLGYTTTWDNIGKTKNSGFELQLSTVNISSNDFKWSTNFTFSTNKEEIVETALGKNDDVSNAWFIGKPIGVYYDYAKNGMWQYADTMTMKRFNTLGNQKYTAGSIRVKDLNGDSIIDATNDRKVVGQKSPKWTAGILNTFTYKGWDFSFFLYARWGQTIYGINPDFQGRYASRKVNYWTPSNPSNDYPRPDYSSASPTYATSLLYEDGSFVKVRNISLGYTFPKVWMQKLRISNFRLYAMLENPFLFAKSKYLDPDVSASNSTDYLSASKNASYPATSVSSKSYVLGLNVTF